MKLRYVLNMFLLLLTCSSWSQRLVEKGHQQFKEMAYSDAIISLEKAVEKGFKSPTIYAELGDSYYFNANYTTSAKWYKLLFTTKSKIVPIYYFRYAQSLKSIGKYEEAEKILQKIENNYFNESGGLVENSATNSNRYQIRPWDFNSSASDFGPSYFGSQIVFASSRDTGSVFKRNHSWTNQSFTDLYVVDSDSLSSKPVKFSNKINSKFNESTAVFTKDGLTMYFTRNNYYNKKLGVNKKQTTLLKIYKAEKKDADWEVVGPLPFCTDNYNVAHPALSADEKTLYFASDMPGGFGLSDLYQVPINADGTFGVPENLGSTINTFGRETFPFVTANELYFASDGHSGLGGLDVFVSVFGQNKTFSKPQNIGEPINSRMDDFGFIINSETKEGFFTSNRFDGNGSDNIYLLKELIPMPCKTILEGIVEIDSAENSTATVEIVLFDANLNPIEKCILDEKGTYNFSVDCAKKYTIAINSKDFISQNIAVESTKFPITPLPVINLQKQLNVFYLGDDIAKKLDLAPIYFDLGRSNIRHDAAVQLERIKTVLKDNPTITIEIRSHTDSRDTFENNQILSNNRANATVKWFVENGIESSRLSGKGLGETHLLNDCVDDVDCTEAEHQLNRRSEFIVTGI